MVCGSLEGHLRRSEGHFAAVKLIAVSGVKASQWQAQLDRSLKHWGSPSPVSGKPC